MSRKMKDSGVAWIGEIPESWSDALLSSILSERKNKNKDMQEENLLSLSYGNIIRKNIDTTDGLLPASFEGYNIIERGDIVLRLTDLQNDHRSLRTGLCKERGIITSAYTTLKQESDKHDSRYLHYYLHCFDLCKGFYGMGDGVRQGLSYDGIRKIPLLLPDKNEEKEIADFIDKKCSQIDALISNQQKQIEKLKTYKHSVITEVVTKGLNPDAEMKENEIRETQPCHWNYTRLKFATEINKPTLIPNDIEEISYSPMECVRSDSFQPKTINTQKLPTGLSTFKEGDVLLAKITPCFENGNVAVAKNLVNGFGVGSSELIPFSPIAILDRFLMYLFQSNRFVENGKSTIRGIGGLRRITMDFIYGYSFYAPDIEEQQSIVIYLDKKCSQIDSLISIKEQKIEKLNQYKKSIIYEYVTGKKEV